MNKFMKENNYMTYGDFEEIMYNEGFELIDIVLDENSDYNYHLSMENSYSEVFEIDSVVEVKEGDLKGLWRVSKFTYDYRSYEIVDEPTHVERVTVNEYDVLKVEHVVQFEKVKNDIEITMDEINNAHNYLWDVENTIDGITSDLLADENEDDAKEAIVNLFKAMIENPQLYASFQKININ